MRTGLAGGGLIAVLASLACRTSAPAADFPALVEASDYIVEGEVRRLEAATLETIEETGRTVVVRVDRVLYAPPGFGDFTGREITVLLAKGHQVEVGQRATFYTHGWLFGDGLAVVETGLAPRGVERVPERIIDLKSTEGLRRRLRSAEVVAEGRVVRVEREDGRPTRRTEHDPRWTLVELDVRSVLKGRARPGRLTFVFPASRDVHWYRAPRPSEGLEGVFLLHRQTDLGARELVVTDPEDVQPLDRLSEVRDLLESR